MNILGATGGEPGRFTADGNSWRFAGGLTFGDANAILASATRLPLPAAGIVDMGGLTHADSAALAVLLALLRRAAAEAKTLRFTQMPAALTVLADVYGVGDLIAS